MISADQADALIPLGIGVFFTLLGYGKIKIGKKPPEWNTAGNEKWEKAQRLYRIAGPLGIGVGLMLFFT